MARWVMAIVAVTVIGLLGTFGAGRYWAAHNTADAAIGTFMNRFAAADASGSYAWLTDGLKRQYPPEAWQSYLQSLGKATSGPEQQDKETIDDQFDVYADTANPQRYTYNLQVQGRQYWVSAVILKQGKFWMVDDLQGGYK